MRMLDAINWPISKDVGSDTTSHMTRRADLCGCPVAFENWIEDNWLHRLMANPAEFPKYRKHYRAPSDSKETELDQAQEFAELVNQWKRETRHSSVIARRYRHPAYKAILEMKSEAIPLILRELRRDPDRWFAALEKLTGENPAMDSENFYEAVDHWIAWGIAKGYVYSE